MKLTCPVCGCSPQVVSAVMNRSLNTWLVCHRALVKSQHRCEVGPYRTKAAAKREWLRRFGQREDDK
jgi:hypothetical protein